MKATIGRIVHYKIRTGEVRPALVLNVLDSGRLSLRVFLDPVRDLLSSLHAYPVDTPKPGAILKIKRASALNCMEMSYVQKSSS